MRKITWLILLIVIISAFLANARSPLIPDYLTDEIFFIKPNTDIEIYVYDDEFSYTPYRLILFTTNQLYVEECSFSRRDITVGRYQECGNEIKLMPLYVVKKDTVLLPYIDRIDSATHYVRRGKDTIYQYSTEPYFTEEDIELLASIHKDTLMLQSIVEGGHWGDTHVWPYVRVRLTPERYYMPECINIEELLNDSTYSK